MVDQKALKYDSRLFLAVADQLKDIDLAMRLPPEPNGAGPPSRLIHLRISLPSHPSKSKYLVFRDIMLPVTFTLRHLIYTIIIAFDYTQEVLEYFDPKMDLLRDGVTPTGVGVNMMEVPSSCTKPMPPLPEIPRITGVDLSRMTISSLLPTLRKPGTMWGLTFMQPEAIKFVHQITLIEETTQVARQDAVLTDGSGKTNREMAVVGEFEDGWDAARSAARLRVYEGRKEFDLIEAGDWQITLAKMEYLDDVKRAQSLSGHASQHDSRDKMEPI